MKLSFANDRVLAVMAHPDDAELLCAGTLARAKADGAAIGIVVMCRGDKGAGSAGGDGDLESRAAGGSGERRRRYSGRRCSGLARATANCLIHTENRRKLIEIFRQFRPTLVIAHAGEDYHADHRAARCWRRRRAGSAPRAGM